MTQFRNPTFAELEAAPPGQLIIERKSSSGYVASLNNIELRSSTRVEDERLPRRQPLTVRQLRRRLIALEDALRLEPGSLIE